MDRRGRRHCATLVCLPVSVIDQPDLPASARPCRAGVLNAEPGGGRSDVGGRIVLGTPKSHQSRTVPIPRFLAREIAQTVLGKEAHDLVFTMPHGSALRLSNWRRAVFVPARGQARISPRFRIHDLRHTAA
jgi:integrase